ARRPVVSRRILSVVAASYATAWKTTDRRRMPPPHSADGRRKPPLGSSADSRRGSEAPPQTDEWIGGSSLLDTRPRPRPRLRQLLRRRVRKLASSVTTQALGDV